MKWALVLSGGGARGLAYIGMLKAFEELGFPKPSCIVGCSAGAIFGGLYSIGITAKELEDFFSNDFDITDYVGASRIYNANSKIMKILQLGSGLSSFMTTGGLDSGEKAYILLKELSLYKTFEDTEIPFYCNASDLCSGKEFIFDTGFLADGMRASSSFPGVFEPFRYKNKILVDGCIKHNTPVWIAEKKGYKNILAVTLDRFEEKPQEEFSNVLSVILRCLEIAPDENFIYQSNCPTAILNISSTGSTYDFSKPEIKIKNGYEEVLRNKKMLETFFTKGIMGIINRNRMKKRTEKLLQYERIF